MTISVAARKAKGRKLQKIIAERISKLLDISCGKDELIESRESSQNGVDVKLIGKARELFPFSIECKNQEKWSILSWIKQAKANQLPNTDWLLFIKKNNIDPLVIVDIEVFFKLMEKIQIHQNIPTF